MKLAISGYRKYYNYDEFCHKITQFLQNNLLKDDKLECIVSGGAIGTDSLAERYARDTNIPILIFKPDYNKYGRNAPIIRNGEIINNATHLLAFPSRYGSGTQNTISRAQQKNLTVYIHYVD